MIDQVNKAGGMAFLAHPYEITLPALTNRISLGELGCNGFHRLGIVERFIKSKQLQTP